MKIAIDLDNTITASSQSEKFFVLLTKMFSPLHEIIILTNREPDTERVIMAELKELGITYTKIVITAHKDRYIIEHGIDIFFEDTDEYFLSLPESVLVFKVREDGNFDFKEKKWVGSVKTTRMIHG